MLNELAKQIKENGASKNFFNTDKNIGEMIALAHSELSKALEADRQEKFCTANMNIVNGWTRDADFGEYFTEHVKDTFQDKLADTVIRILDLAAHTGTNIEAHIQAKMRYNSLMPYSPVKNINSYNKKF